MSIKDKLKEMAEVNEAKLFGVADSDSLANAPNGQRPTDLLPGAKSVIVVGVRLLSTVINLLPESTIEYSADYIQTARKLCSITYNLSRLLEENGFKAYPTNPHGAAYGLPEKNMILPMAAFSHRHAAVAAGLGQIGNHGLLISYKFGVRVRLACIITDASLDIDPGEEKTDKLCQPEKCGWQCMTICPVNAITKNGYEFPQYCFRYNLYGKKELKGPAPLFCGLCLKACQ